MLTRTNKENIPKVYIYRGFHIFISFLHGRNPELVLLMETSISVQVHSISIVLDLLWCMDRLGLACLLLVNNGRFMPHRDESCGSVLSYVLVPVTLLMVT